MGTACRHACRKETIVKKKALINISKKTFINVTALFLGLLAFSIILTFVVPKGDFGILPDGSPNYLQYIPKQDQSGIPIWKGLLAPVLVFFSSDGLAISMLALFLFVISSAFQVMNDTGGVKALLDKVSSTFRSRRGLLLTLISLLFYCFGSFLGLFEEMLTMLPIVAALCISIGYDSFTGFLCCTIACGFGFAGAVTNPFTVLLASQIIGANPMEHIWFRLLMFAMMFAILLLFVFNHVRKITKDPKASLTYNHDQQLMATDMQAEAPTEKSRRTRIAYSIFMFVALALIVTVSIVPSLRGYTVPIITAYFLVFGTVAGFIASLDLKLVLKSFGKGFLGALPTLAFIAFASSVKFVFEEGGIMPTLVHQINAIIEGHSTFTMAISIYLIILVLEFFISSSTAKAILVMGLLAMVNTGLSKQMLVFLYTCADGYTNVIFPTSPVLLISLSMIEVEYFRWIKKGWPLFAAVLLLVTAFILLGLLVGY